MPSSTAALQRQPSRLLVSLLAIATIGLLAACATGSGADGDDDDDDGVAGSGGTPSGSTTSGGTGGVGGTGAMGGTGGHGTGGVRAPAAGEIVFIELMPDPDQLSDFDAEWLEIKNVSTSSLELEGCHLKDADPNGDDLTITGSVTIEPGEILIFAKVANPAQNGNLPDVAFAFGDAYSLANGGDEAELECGGQLVDSVAYTTDWPYDTGASMQLRSDRQTAAENDSMANWCTATATYTADNLGTPGTDTSHCN